MSPATGHAWACVCGDWHLTFPAVITDPCGRVIHAPVPEVEEAMRLPL